MIDIFIQDGCFEVVALAFAFLLIGAACATVFVMDSSEEDSK